MRINISKYAAIVDSYVNNKAIPVASLQVAKALAVTSAALSAAAQKTGEKAVSFATNQLK